MQSTTCLLQKLTDKYPEFVFTASNSFKWSFSDKTIYYDLSDKEFDITLLHELAHALLGHASYIKDIELLNMESEAWAKSIQLAKQYSVAIDDDLVQINLDSYRDWLHKRSICTNCQSTGIQTQKNTYKCVACHQQWTVNEAKNCRLKRTSL